MVRMKHLNRRVMALGLTGVLALGVTGAAFAQVPGGDSGTPAAPTQDAAGPGRHLPHPGLEELAKASGLDVQVFKDGFEAGKSINTVLAENGKDSATVQAAVLADIQVKLTEAVTAGRLTQERADAAYAKAEAGLPNLFDRVPDPDAHHGRHPIRRAVHAVRGLLHNAAETIGITDDQLRDGLKDGQTVGQVAEANGVAPQTVIDALVADGNARIDQAVADGHLDPAKAAEAKTKLAERVTKLVNEGGPRHDGGFGRHGGRP